MALADSAATYTRAGFFDTHRVRDVSVLSRGPGPIKTGHRYPSRRRVPDLSSRWISTPEARRSRSVSTTSPATSQSAAALPHATARAGQSRRESPWSIPPGHYQQGRRPRRRAATPPADHRTATDRLRSTRCPRSKISVETLVVRSINVWQLRETRSSSHAKPEATPSPTSEDSMKWPLSPPRSPVAITS